MFDIPDDAVKTLRKIIPYGYDYSVKNFTFPDSGIGRVWEISVSRHPRQGILLRSTHKGDKSASHSFFGICVLGRTSLVLRSFSLAYENFRPNCQPSILNWVVSTESSWPRFPDFFAAPIAKWTPSRQSKIGDYTGGMVRLCELAEAIDPFIGNDRSI